jgi:hypothetical protein
VYSTGHLTHTRRSDGTPESPLVVLLFLHGNRESSVLSNEIPEESGQFRLIRVVCYDNIKGSLGLILEKLSVMRISIPLDLSSRSFIP